MLLIIKVNAMKRLLFLLLSAIVLCFTGCRKEKPDNPSPFVPVESYSVTAVSDVVDYSVLWSENDSFVQIYEKEDGIIAALALNIKSGAGAREAGFESDSAPVEPLVSLYPASFLDAGNLKKATDGTVPVIWPDVQKYTGTSIPSCPMYSTDKGSTVLFKNVGGILKVTAKGSGRVKNIRLISSSPVSGRADFDVSTAELTFSEGLGKIDLDCGPGLELTADGVDFNICIPCTSITDAGLVFTLDYNGRDVTTFAALESDVAVSAGKIVSASVDVSLDGAFVCVEKQVSLLSSDIIAVAPGFIIRSLKNNDIELTETESSLLSYLVFSILNKSIPVKEYTKTTIHYLTQNPAGEYVLASGLVAWSEDVTAGRKYDRIVSVQHGTCDIDSAPSLVDFPLELAPVFHKTSRNVVILADYLGYGISQTPNLEHPYLHTKFTGSVCADMLHAAETYLATEAGFTYDETVASVKPIGLCGYSQGGQATMATLFALQDRGYTDRIDDVRSGAGPHNLMTLFDSFIKLKAYHFMGYVPYMLRGIIYGEQLDVDIHNVYAPEVFVSGMDVKFNTTMLTGWHKPLGTDVRKVLHPDFFSGEPSSDAKKVMDAVDKNSIVNCGSPVNPSVVTFYHQANDEQVACQCSEEASRKWGCKMEYLTLVDNMHFLGALEFYFKYLGDDVWESVKGELVPITEYIEGIQEAVSSTVVEIR